MDGGIEGVHGSFDDRSELSSLARVENVGKDFDCSQKE